MMKIVHYMTFEYITAQITGPAKKDITIVECSSQRQANRIARQFLEDGWFLISVEEVHRER